MIKECRHCGKTFETEKVTKVYCCVECRRNADNRRHKLSRGERKARRRRLAEERRRDLDICIHPREWMKKRGFING